MRKPKHPLRFYVYIYFHTLYGYPVYIGRGQGGRWLEHTNLKARTRLVKMMKKYGIGPILKIRENLTNEEANETEMAFIKAIGREDIGTGTLYNLTDGGDGQTGWVPSKEVREVWSKHKLGKKQSPELVAKRVEGRRGYRHSEETKAQMSKSQIGQIRGPMTEAEKEHLRQYRTGKKHRPESIEKCRAAKLGKKRAPFSAEHCAKTSATMKGRQKSPEHLANLKIAAQRRAERMRLEKAERIAQEYLAKQAKAPTDE